MTGEKMLASGNIVRWRLERNGPAIAVRLSFSRPEKPSDGDITEAQALSDSLVGSARMVGTIVTPATHRQAAQAIVDEFLGMGARN